MEIVSIWMCLDVPNILYIFVPNNLNISSLVLLPGALARTGHFLCLWASLMIGYLVSKWHTGQPQVTDGNLGLLL